MKDFKDRECSSGLQIDVGIFGRLFWFIWVDIDQQVVSIGIARHVSWDICLVKMHALTKYATYFVSEHTRFQGNVVLLWNLAQLR